MSVKFHRNPHYGLLEHEIKSYHEARAESGVTCIRVTGQWSSVGKRVVSRINEGMNSLYRRQNRRSMLRTISSLLLVDTRYTVLLLFTVVSYSTTTFYSHEDSTQATSSFDDFPLIGVKYYLFLSEENKVWKRVFLISFIATIITARSIDLSYL